MAHHEVHSGGQGRGSAACLGARRPGRRFDDAARVVARTPSSSGTASTRTNCGSRSGADGTLQHPPVPALWLDKDAGRPTTSSPAGKGTVFSFVVHHAPKVPGRTLPFVIALVELEEGVRMLGELRNVDPATVEIGMPVRATYIDFPANDVGSGLDAIRMGAWPSMSAPVHRGRDQAARAQALRRPDVHRVDRDRHPRLPGRAPRPGQGAGQGFQGHLRQHPHRHRSGAALHHRLGRARTR